MGLGWEGRVEERIFKRITNTKEILKNRAWWYMSLFSALRTQRQVDFSAFKATLTYISGQPEVLR